MSPEKVRALRLSLGMTQQEMADYLGLKHKSQVTHLESGRTPATGPVLRLLLILDATGGETFHSVQTLEKKSQKNSNRG